MNVSTIEKGSIGENAAAGFLVSRGYKIIERNFRSHYGEIDIIAFQGDMLAFVEVKMRHQGSLTRPCEAVTKLKQSRILKTAHIFLTVRGSAYEKYFKRFDVIEVISDIKTNKAISINHIENAYTQGGAYAPF